MNISSEQLFKFCAALLEEYNIPLEFEKDGIYLQESINKILIQQNINQNTLSISEQAFEKSK